VFIKKKKMKKNVFTAISTLLIIVVGHDQVHGSNAVSPVNTNMDSIILIALIAFILLLLLAIGILVGTIRGLSENKRIWKSSSSKNTLLLLILGSCSLFPSPMMAATTASAAFQLPNHMLYLLIAAVIFLFLIVLFLSRVLQHLLNQLSGRKEEIPLVSKLASTFTEAIPIEREDEIMTDHEYDGIRELDNVLPPWWVYMFYITIIFSFVYIIRYHISGSGNIMQDEYLAEMQLVEEQQNAAQQEGKLTIDEHNVTQLVQETDLERGKAIFNSNCASCHNVNGGGGVGPNLTDPYWIHGGGIKSIFSTIKYGVPEKGMISWQAQINPNDMQKVASYILLLSGSNPSGAKAPQGDLYEEKENTATDTITGTDLTTH
jgi:cytochrome c oxidase cbb3-type subunit 3